MSGDGLSIRFILWVSFVCAAGVGILTAAVYGIGFLLGAWG